MIEIMIESTNGIDIEDFIKNYKEEDFKWKNFTFVRLFRIKKFTKNLKCKKYKQLRRRK